MMVSVVITTCNRNDYLLEALDSVYKQTLSASEVIVIDDGNTKKEFIDNLILKYSSIKYIKNEVPQGANYSRNLGAKEAKGQYVAFMDDDDIWQENKLEVQVDNILKYKCDCSLVSFNYMRDGEITCRLSKCQSGIVDINSLKSGNPYCGMSGVLVTKNVMNHISFDNELPCGQDWDFYISILKRFSCHYDSKPLFNYRVFGQDSITKKIVDLDFDGFLKRLRSAKKHAEFMGKDNYKNRVAEQITKFFPVRRQKLKLLKYGFSEVGVWLLLRYVLKDSLKYVLKR